MPKNDNKFRVGDLFDIHPTKRYDLTDAQLYKLKGNTPVISNTSYNNGISGYVGFEPTENGNIITFSDTTTGGDTMFYQPSPFVGYSHIQGMYPINPEKWNEKRCLYFIAALKKACGDVWDYSNKFNRKIVADIKVVLPIVEGTKDEIDFDYMEQIIISLEEKIIEELEIKKERTLEAYRKVTNMNDYHLTESDISILTSQLLPPSENNTVSFKSFSLGRLFEHSTGDVDLQQKDINGKGCFFINSGCTNNGIKGKTDRPAKIFPANTISIDFWGNAYYRDFEYKMATHNHVFSLTGDVIKNENVGLYLVGLLSKFPLLFSWDNMATWERLKNLEIELPVNKNTNEIDFDYMEQYIRAVKKMVVNEKIEHLNNIIQITKKVISE